VFDLIADYAGFPLEGEAEDCHRLMYVACKMNQVFLPQKRVVFEIAVLEKRFDSI
jgi:hypothetical protein